MGLKLAKLEQDIRKRKIDGQFEVWQKMPVTWSAHFLDGTYDRALGFTTEDWVLVALFSEYMPAVRFCNSCFLASKERAPETAGDGSGQSLSQPWIEVLSVRNETSEDFSIGTV